jgi:hypothetical protein
MWKTFVQGHILSTGGDALTTVIHWGYTSLLS